MAGLSVAPVSNPTLSGISAPNNPTISGVISATPGSNGFATLSQPSTTTPAATTPAAPPTSPLDAQIAALQAQISASQQQVYAPALDTNAIFNQAASTAASNVNPYYTKLLNDFITQQGTAKAQQQTQTQTNIANLQTQLQQLQAANAVTGQRATEDAATSEANAAGVTDARQTAQGTAFDTARDVQATGLAASGLEGSGLANRAENTSQVAQDTTETQQATVDQQTKDATELGKARTFEDLATSNANATTTEAQGEQQQEFNLNNFITGQTTDLANEQQTLEQQRQQSLATEQANQTKLLVNNFINSISNPAQRQAALQAYGGFL